MHYPMYKLNVMPFTGLDPLISKKKWWFPKGYPQFSSIDGFSRINHPAIGYPHLRKAPYLYHHWPLSRPKFQSRLRTPLDELAHQGHPSQSVRPLGRQPSGDRTK